MIYDSGLLLWLPCNCMCVAKVLTLNNYVAIRETFINWNGSKTRFRIRPWNPQGGGGWWRRPEPQPGGDGDASSQFPPLEAYVFNVLISTPKACTPVDIGRVVLRTVLGPVLICAKQISCCSIKHIIENRSVAVST